MNFAPEAFTNHSISPPMSIVGAVLSTPTQIEQQRTALANERTAREARVKQIFALLMRAHELASRDVLTPEERAELQELLPIDRELKSEMMCLNREIELINQQMRRLGVGHLVGYHQFSAQEHERREYVAAHPEEQLGSSSSSSSSTMARGPSGKSSPAKRARDE